MNNLIKLLDKNLEYIEHEIIEDTIYISVKSIKEYMVLCQYFGHKKSNFFMLHF